MRTLLVVALLGLFAYLGLHGLPHLATSPTAQTQEVATIFVDPNDPTAWEAERFFRDRGIQVKLRDIVRDADAHAEYIRRGAGALPVIVFHGQQFEGFRSWEVERVLDQRSRQRPVGATF